MSTKVKYSVKKPIYGFEDIQEVEIEKNDGITSVLNEVGGDVQMTLINAFVDDEHIEIPSSIKTLLDINDNTNVSISFVVVLNNSDLTKSAINLGSPIIFNEDNKTMAQVSINTEMSTIEKLFEV
ncbi:MAG: flagellar assembly protein FliW [Arcobacteraceae bacterium]|jgi:flagellar assembly factor FliW|nr:flagellar assembly protein FliW [Arcobacteraceae bacterium]